MHEKPQRLTKTNAQRDIPCSKVSNYNYYELNSLYPSWKVTKSLRGNSAHRI